MTKLRIGTRGSPLALAQAEETRSRLAVAHGLIPTDFEIVVISTTGDRVTDRPLYEVGGKGLFTKEIEDALLAGTIDLAVHSMKDVAAKESHGLRFAALLPREDARDAFLSQKAKSLAALPPGATLGSSSVRRSAQALRRRPDLAIVPFRGNVETRLRKLAEGIVDATFLAVAGLKRLGLAQRITSLIEPEVMLPALAQGAIGLQIRAGDEATTRFVTIVNHRETSLAIACERAFLATLDGSCRTPIAGHATIAKDTLTFHGETLTPDGKHVFSASRTGAVADAVRLGIDAALEVKAKGGSLIST